MKVIPLETELLRHCSIIHNTQHTIIIGPTCPTHTKIKYPSLGLTLSTPRLICDLKVLTEMFLGQYSGLSAVHIFPNMSPLLAGLGAAMYITVIIRSVLNIALMVWVSRALYDLFTLLDTNTGMETVKVAATLQHATPTSEALFR